MKKARKIHPPRPPKPPDYPQNPRTLRLPGKNDWGACSLEMGLY